MMHIHLNAKGLRGKYKKQFTDRAFIVSLIKGVLLLLVAIVINYLAGTYATESATSYVGDIILSNIPVFDVDWFFVYGPLIFWVITIIYVFNDPRKIPFSLKAISLFVIIRSVFISLTHIGPFPDHVAVDAFSFWHGVNLFIFNSGADLFFSAHTGLPFLMALVFWRDRGMRYFCLIASLFFGTIVLMGHLHYSIDVLSAFFITYTIYHIASVFFRKDKTRLDAPNL